MFVDKVQVHFKAGGGGAGVASFHRQKGKPRGKPDGGSGGRGGDILVRASSQVTTLMRYSRQPHWTAEHGSHGEGDRRHGRAGNSLIVEVPPGTMIYDHGGTLHADLARDGQQYVAARGGRGGRGNAAFVAPKRKAPTFAEQGEFGDEIWITLQLKLMADAALIGFPNAGKSTLISRVSAARPKIADYPFTTLEPSLGVVQLGDREIVLADIPGLIEGAADGKGLGHEFLQHTERARVLVFILDPSDLQQMPPAEQFRVLRRELASHSHDLSLRPFVVALSKVELLDDVAAIHDWAADHDFPLYPISSLTGDGLDKLMFAVADEVARHRKESPDREGFVLHRPLDASFSVRREGSAWVVEGRAADRAVNLSDLTIAEAADFAAKRLKHAGIDHALSAAGVQPGDQVRIGDIIFLYEPDPT